MQINALLDVEVVAVQNEDQVTAMLELTAPSAPAHQSRPPGTLEVVLDRSGSMSDGRLEAAKDALLALLSRLDPADSFGLVTFDDSAQVAVASGPLADKDTARHVVSALHPGSTTNLSGGLLRGVAEARRVKGERGATLLLLSDGHANHGVTAHGELERIAAAACSHGITVSTIGMGLGYDELLMAAIARGGAGNAHFAEQGDAAGAAVASEVDGLLDQVVHAASLTVRPSSAVSAVRLFNDLPVAPLEDGFMVELGDFYAGEKRKLLMHVDVPALAGLGLRQVCELELSWVDVASLDTQTATLPLHVNVVPGDQAAGRVPNPVVRTEAAFQRAQRAKKEAGEALRAGQAAEASRRLHDAGAALDAVDAAPAMAAELVDESRLLYDMAARAEHEDPSRLAKLSEADRHLKERRRGRPRPKGH